ncbi:hypothetical protein [Streptomyces cadmiisoli]
MNLKAQAYGVRRLYPEVTEMIVRHGACPTGADKYAEEWVSEQAGKWPFTVSSDPMPAYWSGYGKNAGPKRNTAMVAKGADECMAFMRLGSRGTMDCLVKAIKAGIITTVLHEEDSNNETYATEAN